MVVITCKECGELEYLTSKALGNLTDFGYKCRNCNTINRITLEDGDLKNKNSQKTDWKKGEWGLVSLPLHHKHHQYRLHLNLADLG
jgi:hypothetical protein